MGFNPQNVRFLSLPLFNPHILTSIHPHSSHLHYTFDMILTVNYDVLENICFFLDFASISALLSCHPKLNEALRDSISLFKNLYRNEIWPLSSSRQAAIPNGDWRKRCQRSLLKKRLRSRGQNYVTKMTGFLSSQLTTNQMIDDFIIMALPRSATVTIFNTKITNSNNETPSSNIRFPPIVVSNDSEISFMAVQDSFVVIGDSLGIIRVFRMQAERHALEKLFEVNGPNFRELLHHGRQMSNRLNSIHHQGDSSSSSSSSSNTIQKILAKKVRYSGPSPITCLKYDEPRIICGNQAGDLAMYEYIPEKASFKLQWMSQVHEKAISCIQNDHKIVVSGDVANGVFVHDAVGGKILFHFDYNEAQAASMMDDELRDADSKGVACIHFDCKRIVIGFKNGLLAIAHLDRMARTALQLNTSVFQLKPIICNRNHKRSVTCCQLMIPCLSYSDVMLNFLDKFSSCSNAHSFPIFPKEQQKTLNKKSSLSSSGLGDESRQYEASVSGWTVTDLPKTKRDTNIWPEEDISNFNVAQNCILSGSNDRLIKLTNALDGACLFTFSGHTAPIISLQYIVSQQIEDLLTGDPLQPESKDLISESQFLRRSWSSLPDDLPFAKHFWSMSRDGSVIKWDLVNGTVLSVQLSMQASFLALMVLLRE